jgi:hypothetical protein
MLSGGSRRWVGIVVSIAALLVGLGLRLAYASHASPYIDEFATVWAAQRTLVAGVPSLPSGAIYTQGLLYTYLEAGVLALVGDYSPFLSRLPSLGLSAVVLALVVYAARRLYHTWPVGLAALWLAIDEQAILWGGRVRTYALLQVLVLAAFLAWYRGAVQEDRPGVRWLAIGLLLLALVEQPLVLLLLPPFALLALIARGRALLAQPVAWLQAGVVILGVAARWAVYGLMSPVDASMIVVSPRPFADLSQPFASWDSVAPFFLEPNRLLPTLFVLGGVLWLLVQRKKGMPNWGWPVLSLAFIIAVVTLEMSLFVGIEWRHHRYLYPLTPLFFLAAEGTAVPALVALVQRVPSSHRRWASAGLVTLSLAIIVWAGYPGAASAATNEERGYDQALAVVRENWSEGDALATIVPAAAFVILDRCDYLPIQQGVELVPKIESRGRYVDSWTQLPLLSSPDELAEALDAHPRLWFVVDDARLERHFNRDYLQMLWQRFDLVDVRRGALVFRSRTDREPVALLQPVGVDFAGELRLAAYALSDGQPEPGQKVTVTLFWDPIAPSGQYTAFVHLIDRADQGITGHDAPPLGGFYPVEGWHRLSSGEPLPDRHPLTLPHDLTPGRYRLEAGLYRPGTLETVGQRLALGFLTIEDPNWALPPSPPVASFGDAATLYLAGLDGESRIGGIAYLDLVWQTGPAAFDGDYTLFLHLLDSDGAIAQQFDAPPTGGWYPTSYWQPGEIVYDEHVLAFSPMLAPGQYRLVAGLYRADGTRLALSDGSGAAELATIELLP